MLTDADIAKIRSFKKPCIFVHPDDLFKLANTDKVHVLHSYSIPVKTNHWLEKDKMVIVDISDWNDIEPIDLCQQ